MARARTSSHEGSARHVALLRGINVGGKNRLPMSDLVALFEEAGCAEVRTYIQSGNVVFDASPSLAREVAAVIEAAIARTTGLRVPVITRSARELAALVRANPFVEEGPREALHVALLAAAPTRAQVASLDPDRSPPDTFRALGREVYLRCPGGLGRSKLTTAWLDAKLGTTSTVRSWRTTLQLLAMTEA